VSEIIQDLFRSQADLSTLVQTAGLVGIALIVFVETGLLVGFFLPGDSLLITAGVFAARGELDLGALVLWTSLAATLGDATGYAIGRRAGVAIGEAARPAWIRPDDLRRAEGFYARHGGKTIVLARFVPLVRTLAPLVAGAAAMPYRRFLVWNVVGALLWVGSMSLTGYFLGLAVAELEGPLLWLLLSVLAVAALVGAGRWWRDRGPRDESAAPEGATGRRWRIALRRYKRRRALTPALAAARSRRA
jgi:membrane-associated protein